MALAKNWIKVKEAMTYPEVIRVFKKAGGGQGAGNGFGAAGVNGPTTPASAPRGFLNAVRYYFQSASNGTGQTLPAWLRAAPGSAPGDWQNSQVDVTSIPGVRQLRDNGKWAGWPN